MHNFEDMGFMNSAFNTGAFVTSGDNVMVASWGFVGVMWGKKVFVAPIRDSRYTKEMLDKTGEFTVSVPAAGTMKKELAFCGSNEPLRFRYDEDQERPRLRQVGGNGDEKTGGERGRHLRRCGLREIFRVPRARRAAYGGYGHKPSGAMVRGR